MKRLSIVTFVTFCFLLSLSLNAQVKPDTDPDPKLPPAKSGVLMMKDGKMMKMKEGKTTAMGEEVTLNNGTMVMTDGTVKNKDGKLITTLKDGDRILMDGTVKHHKTLKKNMSTSGM